MLLQAVIQGRAFIWMLWIILWKRPSLLTMEGVSGEGRQLEEMINSSVAFTSTYPCKRPNYLLLGLWLIIQTCSKKGQSRCNKEHERRKNKVPYSVVCNPNTWTTDSSAMCISTILTRNTINSTYTRLDLPIGSTTLRKINRAQHDGGHCWEGVSRRNHCRRKWQLNSYSHLHLQTFRISLWHCSNVYLLFHFPEGMKKQRFFTKDPFQSH